MKVIKYKKLANSRYKVYLDNSHELLLYEDVILKYNLLIRKDIDEDLIIEMDKYNQECDVYYVALNSIKNRFRSVYELRGILLKKEYPIDLVESAIKKLIKQGYLNDRSYCKSFINNQMITTNNGPFKIIRQLNEKKVDSSIIDEEISIFDDEEQSLRIKKLIDKGIKSNHTRGGVVLKQKIYNDLKNLGYDISLINNTINLYEFGNNSDIAKKEYDKLYKKYSRKYSGDELKYKIREKMYLKGLNYEEE
ncbi:MAG: RecX family transcriptional regulator [Bacilli bacterium]|nr:RecX family transcriptional regulator [Bacilli bacterium]